ncbi:MAG: hypothetical protein FJZ01_23975, partial [Candidatus Sericytochromatia bacterium]|nr:hypothetical protein [Candidatus Tanganyikabacteria bacterium]
MSSLFHGDTGAFYDEMFERPGEPRPHYRHLFEVLSGLRADEFEYKRRLADATFLTQGITFAVYGDERRTEKIFPFDLVPRIIPDSEWGPIEDGLRQLSRPTIWRRVRARIGRPGSEGCVSRGQLGRMNPAGL